jgi:hypothetical protein
MSGSSPEQQIIASLKTIALGTGGSELPDPDYSNDTQVATVAAGYLNMISEAFGCGQLDLSNIQTISDAMSIACTLLSRIAGAV